MTSMAEDQMATDDHSPEQAVATMEFDGEEDNTSDREMTDVDDNDGGTVTDAREELPLPDLDSQYRTDGNEKVLLMSSDDHSIQSDHVPPFDVDEQEHEALHEVQQNDVIHTAPPPAIEDETTSPDPVAGRTISSLLRLDDDDAHKWLVAPIGEVQDKPKDPNHASKVVDDLADNDLSSYVTFQDDHDDNPADLEHVQRETDEQLRSEASMSDGLDGDQDNVMYQAEGEYMDEVQQTIPAYRSVREHSVSGLPKHTSHSQAGQSPRTQQRQATEPLRRHAPRLQHTVALESPTPVISQTDDERDLLKVISFKFRQKDETLRSAFAQEREELNRELVASYETINELRGKLGDMQTAFHKLNAETGKEREKREKRVAALVQTGHKFSKILNGLGNDLLSLKHHRDDIGEMKEAASFDLDAFRKLFAEHRTLLDEHRKFEGIVRESRIKYKDVALMADAECNSLKQTLQSVQADLRDKADNLTKEKAKCEQLKLRVIDLEIGERARIAQCIDQFRITITDELKKVRATDDGLVIALGSVHAAVMEASNKAVATPSDCAAIREHLSEMTQQDRHIGLIIEKVSQQHPELAASISKSLDGAVGTIRQDLAHWKDSQEQNAIDQQRHTDLVKQLEDSQRRAAELETQLSEAKRTEDALNRNVQEHASRIEDLVTRISSGDSVAGFTEAEVERQVQLARDETKKTMSASVTLFRAQLKAQSDNELKKAIAERDDATRLCDQHAEAVKNLGLEIDQLRNGRQTATSDAQQQLQQLHHAEQKVKSLQYELEAAHSAAIGKGTIEAKNGALAAEIDGLKTLVAKLRESHAELALSLEESTIAGQRAQTEADRVHSDNEKLKSESAAAIQDVQLKLSEAEGRTERAEAGVVKMKDSGNAVIQKEREKHRNQIDDLQSRLSDAQRELHDRLRELADFKASVEQKWTAQQRVLQEKIDNATSKATEIATATDEAGKSIEKLKQERDAVVNELAEYRTFKNEAVKALARLELERDAVSHESAQHCASKDEAVASLTKLEQERDATVNELARLHDSRDQATRSLARMEQERHAAVNELVQHHSAKDEAAKSLTKMQQERNAAVDELAQLLATTAQTVAPTLANMEITITAQSTESRVIQKDMISESSVAQSSASRPSIGVTPNTVVSTTAPPRPRRKLDRSANKVVNTQPIPAPEVIKPKSREVPAVVFERSPIAEESQFADLIACVTKDSQVHEHSQLHTSSSSYSDEMLDTAPAQDLSATVPETQLDESLPTFATFKHGMSSSKTLPTMFTSSYACGDSTYFDQAMRPSASTPTLARDVQSDMASSQAQDADEQSFQIFEDTPQSVAVHSQDLAVDSQHVASANYDYTFRKAVPKPNSASKRSAPSGSVANGQHLTLEAKTITTRYQTPETSNKRKQANAAQARNQSEGDENSVSSTPPFMKQPSNRSQQTFRNPISSAKSTHRASNDASAVTADPRLIGRAPNRKRAVEIAETPDTESPPQRRRMSNAVTRAQGLTSGPESAIRSSQSVNDQPRITNPTYRFSSTGGASTRMRTFAGTSTRGSTGRKKGAKNDEYGSRFSQELRGR